MRTSSFGAGACGGDCTLTTGGKCVRTDAPEPMKLDELIQVKDASPDELQVTDASPEKVAPSEAPPSEAPPSEKPDQLAEDSSAPGDDADDNPIAEFLAGRKEKQESREVIRP